MKVPIGKDLKLDVTRLVETRMILSASSGGGKSMTGRTILEATHSLVPHIVLDKEGEFPSLREKYDYVLAGKGGDIPISPRTAELLARKILENNISIILDLYDLKHDEKHRFVRLFIDALINSPKELWAPRIVMIGESHHFCPENGEGTSEAKDSIIELLEAGRKRGLGTILDTQRLSKLDKSAAAECQNKLFGLTNWDDDRKRAAKELGFSTKEDVLSLRDMEPGEFYAIGPALSRQVVKTQIFKAHTSHPMIGRRSMRTPVATKKIQKVLEKLKDIPQEAEVELRTLAQLKGRIGELEAKIRELSKIPKPEVFIQKFDEKLMKAELDKFKIEMKKGFQKNRNELISQFTKSVIEWQKNLMEQFRNVSVTSTWEPPVRPEHDTSFPMDDPTAFFEKRQAPFLIPTHKPIAPFKPTHMEVLSPPGDSETKFNKCDRQVVAFMAIDPSKKWTKNQIALGSGYSVGSGGFANTLSKLRTAGILSGNGKELAINIDTAIAVLGEIPRSSKNVREVWEANLNKCEREIWKYLESHGAGYILSKDEVAAATGYSVSSGGFNNALSHLTTLKIILRDSGNICLNPEALTI